MNNDDDAGELGSCPEHGFVPQSRGDLAFRYLASEVWPLLGSEQTGKPLSRHEEDNLLGYGPEGY